MNNFDCGFGPDNIHHLYVTVSLLILKKQIADSEVYLVELPNLKAVLILQKQKQLTANVINFTVFPYFGTYCTSDDKWL